MAREARGKSALTAYVLLLTLGTLGAHRFYLGRHVSGMIIIALSIGGCALLWNGYQSDAQRQMYAGAIVAAAVVTFLLIDILMIPGMIDARDKRERAAKVSVMMGNLDPSFQATMRQAGREDIDDEIVDRPPTQRYDRPWHRREPETMVYSPSAQTGAAVQAGIPAHAIPSGRPPRPDLSQVDLAYADHQPRRRRRAER